MAERVDTPKIHDKEIVRLEKEEIPAILTAAETGDGLGGRQESFHKHTKIRDSAIIALFWGRESATASWSVLILTTLIFQITALS